MDLARLQHADRRQLRELDDHRRPLRAQLLEHGARAAPREIADDARDRRTDAGQLLEPALVEQPVQALRGLDRLARRCRRPSRDGGRRRDRSRPRSRAACAAIVVGSIIAALPHSGRARRRAGFLRLGWHVHRHARDARLNRRPASCGMPPSVPPGRVGVGVVELPGVTGVVPGVDRRRRRDPALPGGTGAGVSRRAAAAASGAGVRRPRSTGFDGSPESVSSGPVGVARPASRASPAGCARATAGRRHPIPAAGWAPRALDGPRHRARRCAHVET